MEFFRSKTNKKGIICFFTQDISKIEKTSCRRSRILCAYWKERGKKVVRLEFLYPNHVFGTVCGNTVRNCFNCFSLQKHTDHMHKGPQIIPWLGIKMKQTNQNISIYLSLYIYISLYIDIYLYIYIYLWIQYIVISIFLFLKQQQAQTFMILSANANDRRVKRQRGRVRNLLFDNIF